MKANSRDLKPANESSTPAKPSRRGRKPAKPAATDGLEQINLHAAGIDVGSAENFVCVPASAVKATEASGEKASAPPAPPKPVPAAAPDRARESTRLEILEIWQALVLRRARLLQ